MGDFERELAVLVEQLRVGAIKAQGGPWILELVAGVVEEGESPEKVAMIKLPLEEAFAMLDQHRFVNATIISALQWLRQKRSSAQGV